MRLAAARLAMRIARRDALRAPGRSALVIVLVALPIAALTAADVVYLTGQLDPGERAQRLLGGADAAISYAGGRVVQRPDGQAYSTTSTADGSPPLVPRARLARLLPPGTRLLEDRSQQGLARGTRGTTLIGMRGIDLGDPLARSLVRLEAGRAPQAAGEAVLTPALAHDLGAGVGGLLRTVAPARTYRIVGLASMPDATAARTAFMLPAALPRLQGPRDGEVVQRWLVRAPRPLTWRDVLRLDGAGWVTVAREVLLRPPPGSEVPFDRIAGPGAGRPVEVVAAGVVAIGIALLEVVLLAGPAFAVGVRRRRRALALLAAAGARPGDVGRVVLAEGALLGAAGAVLAVPLGLGLARILLHWYASYYGSEPGRFDARPLELLALVAVGVVTGLAAAAVPAWAASRQDVAAALSGRRGAARVRRRFPALGLGLLTLGAAVAVTGAARSLPGLSIAEVVLAGSVVAQVGLILCAPAAVALAGAMGGRLPLAGRLALRDASRNRSSTAPALCAVMTAVAGSVALGVVIASQSAHDRHAYLPSLPVGSAGVILAQHPGPAAVPRVEAVLRRTLPLRRLATVGALPCGERTCPNLSVDPLAGSPCAQVGGVVRDRAGCDRIANASSSVYGNAVIDDGRALPLLVGHPVPRAVEALRRGRAVVLLPMSVAGGRARLTVDGLPGRDRPRVRRVPAMALPATTRFVDVVLPPALAAGLGLHARAAGVIASTARMPSADEEAAARGQLLTAGAQASLVVERGYDDRYPIGLLALVVASAIVTLGAAAIATSLANEEGRADLVTLAAVGATPGLRRRLSVARAGLIAVIGSAFGLAAGIVPGVGLVLALRHRDAVAGIAAARPLVLPWESLALTVLVVPAIALAAAALLTRARLPSERPRST